MPVSTVTWNESGSSRNQRLKNICMIYIKQGMAYATLDALMQSKGFTSGEISTAITELQSEGKIVTT